MLFCTLISFPPKETLPILQELILQSMSPEKLEFLLFTCPKTKTDEQIWMQGKGGTVTPQHTYIIIIPNCFPEHMNWLFQQQLMTYMMFGK